MASVIHLKPYKWMINISFSNAKARNDLIVANLPDHELRSEINRSPTHGGLAWFLITDPRGKLSDIYYNDFVKQLGVLRISAHSPVPAPVDYMYACM